MRQKKIIMRALSVISLVIGTSSAASAGQLSQSNAIVLDNHQLDRVTAGSVALDLSSVAMATGSFASASTAGAGISSSTNLPLGGFVEGGGVAGNSVAIALGGTMSTGVTTSATSSLPITGASGTAGGTVASPYGSVSISMSYAFGGTTIFP